LSITSDPPHGVTVLTYMQYEKNTKYKHINANESTHSEMSPV